jgi:DNA-directed RNA polymerase alpha subunit
MVNRILDKNIKILVLDEEILPVLKNNNIVNIRDLLVLNRKSLKNIKLNDKQINDIIIKLQLIGLDLNKKIY